MTAFARVVFPLPLSQSFLYRVPETLGDEILRGIRVRVPLGKKTVVGFVVAVGEKPPRERELKDVLGVLDERPIWNDAFLEFTRVLAAETFSSWGEILQASLPPSLAPRTRVRVIPTPRLEETPGKKGLGRREKQILDLISGTRGRAPLFLQRRTGIRDIRAVLARMAKKGLLTIQEDELPPPAFRRRDRPGGLVQLELGFASLSPAPSVLGPILEKLGRDEARPAYLFGSDAARAEAYEILIRRALDRGGRVLVLVPEVSMTGDVVSRIKRRLGREAAVFHGGLTSRQKEMAWRSIRSGRAPVVVGTRSALFLDPNPFALTVVDGEHEESFEQKAHPVYDARRGAWLRAREEKGVVVFGSDRPTVEAFHDAGREGVLLRLDRKPFPRPVTWVSHAAAHPLLSGALREKIGETLRKDGSAVLFLNRRGYAASLMCPACGHVPRCRSCDIPLVFHKDGERLVCHYCNASSPPEGACPVCGGRTSPRRTGGTQALEEELKTVFPGVSLARFDADTAPGPKERKKILGAFSRGKVRLLVGTQLLAYTPRVPDVRLLGILSPESLLGSADYRASQKTFQAVSQMVSLAGPGTEIVVQTVKSPHFSVRAAAEGDYEAFYNREIDFRRMMNYPPFGALAGITLLGTELRALAAHARRLRGLLVEADPDLEVLGPAFAAVVRVRNVFRLEIVLKAPHRGDLVRVLGNILPRIRVRKTVSVSYSPFG